jgi:hypothetical protein
MHYWNGQRGLSGRSPRFKLRHILPRLLLLRLISDWSFYELAIVRRRFIPLSSLVQYPRNVKQQPRVVAHFIR